MEKPNRNALLEPPGKRTKRVLVVVLLVCIVPLAIRVSDHLYEMFLIRLAGKSDLKTLSWILSIHPGVVNKRMDCYQDRTLLHLAMDPLSPEIVNLLLQNGADPNIENRFGMNSLQEIAVHRSARDKEVYEVAEQLIANGANVDGGRHKRSPLQISVEGNGPLSFAKLLVENGADVNEKNSSGRSLIDIALKQENNELAEYLRSVSGNISTEIPESATGEATSSTPSTGNQ